MGRDLKAFTGPDGLVLTGEARLADAVVAVDAVFADAVVTRVAGAVVKVDLAVGACVETEKCYSSKKGTRVQTLDCYAHPRPPGT